LGELTKTRGGADTSEQQFDRVRFVASDAGQLSLQHGIDMLELTDGRIRQRLRRKRLAIATAKTRRIRKEPFTAFPLGPSDQVLLSPFLSKADLDPAPIR
jgi:hypothetical protein